MRNITLTISALACTLSSLFAQYEKIYYADQKIETDEYKVEISNIVGMDAEIKFKLEIENTTSDFLLFDASKCSFTINGAKVSPKKDKFLIIEPYGKKSKTIGALGSGYAAVREFSFEMNGVQRVIMLDEKIEVAPFNLPPSANNFTAGAFKVDLKKHSKETALTAAKFDVQYNGKKIGFVIPANINVLMPDGNTYANADKGTDPILLFPGDADKFTATWERMPGGRVNDMQLVKMIVNFQDVFKEGEAKDLSLQTINFTWDEALTIGKQ